MVASSQEVVQHGTLQRRGCSRCLNCQTTVLGNGREFGPKSRDVFHAKLSKGRQDRMLFVDQTSSCQFLNISLQFEILFCIQDQEDSRLRYFVESLIEKYPNVDAKVSIPDLTSSLKSPSWLSSEFA